MIGWLDAHAGIALWLTALGLAVSATTAFVLARRRRLAQERALLCAVLHPVRSLCEGVRVLREVMEQGEGKSRLTEVALLVDGSLAQRLRDVRGLTIQGLPSPRSIEAAYEAKEAAARLMVWLERTTGEPTERRLSVQLIWKALHDATGNLERDLARLESSTAVGNRRF
jgi:hypothetical protein